MTDCFPKSEYFQKPRITVIGSSQWQVSVISIFSVIWGKAVCTLKATVLRGGGYGYTQKRFAHCTSKVDTVTGSNVAWTIQNILLRTFYFLWWDKSNTKEIKTTLCFACQININLKIINKLKFLGVPWNFLHWMSDWLTHKKD